jgi:iron(III) transport system permease protein
VRNPQKSGPFNFTVHQLPGQSTQALDDYRPESDFLPLPAARAID